MAMKSRCVLFCVCLLLFAQHTQAQLEILAALPPCALNCITKHVSDTACSITDFSCLCADKQLWDDVSICAMAQCTTREALTAQKLSNRTCKVPVRNISANLPIVETTLTTVAAIFLTLRIIARSPRRWELMGWDDGFIIICFVTGIPLTVTGYFLAHNGIGQDIWEVPFANIDSMLFWFYVAEPFYLCSTLFMKISILSFYLRVFVDAQFRKVVFVVMGFCVAYAIAFFVALLLQCHPISYAWTHWDSEVLGTCINVNAGVWSHAVVNILFDLIVLALPIHPLLRLKFAYSWQSKVQIGVMFGIGLLVTLVSALRLGSLIGVASTLNPTWDYFGSAVWSGVEVWVGVICACLPTARVFLTRMLPKWLGLSYAKSSDEQRPSSFQKRRRAPSKHILSWKPGHSQFDTTDSEVNTADFIQLKNDEGNRGFGVVRAV